MAEEKNEVAELIAELVGLQVFACIPAACAAYVLGLDFKHAYVATTGMVWALSLAGVK